MFGQILAIIRNTFFESIRQPVVFVLLVVATLLIIFANMTATFTMDEDQKMLVDIGLATVFVFGMLLAAFIATNVLTREIDNKTVLTVISKPVGRPLFVLGKFLGVALAILVCVSYMSFVFLLVENHGVLDTVRTPWHVPVLVFGFSAGVISLIVGIWCNYFYGKVFTSTTICTVTPLSGLAYFFSLMFDPHFMFRDIGRSFEPNIWVAITALFVAILVLTSIAIAVSTRFGQLMTILVTIGIFMLGMLSDSLVGTQRARLEGIWMERARITQQVESVTVDRTTRYTDGEVKTISEEIEVPTVPLASLARGNERASYNAYTVAYSMLPNFQVLWLSDAVTQNHVIPASYVSRISVYGLLYIIASLSMGVILFQRREVG